MMAVWLSTKMTFPVLLRSSAMAGMLMFFGACMLVALWGLLPSSYALFYSNFHQPILAFLVTVGLLGVIGILRGMLDAWVYHRILAKRKMGKPKLPMYRLWFSPTHFPHAPFLVLAPPCILLINCILAHPVVYI